MTIDKICQFTKDILDFDESKIIQARTNYENIDFNDNIILVDTLSGAIKGKEKIFDPILEKQKLSLINKFVFTLDFFGTASHDNLMRFINRQSTQKALDLMKLYDMSVFHSLNPRDLKNVGGATTYQRWQLEISVIDIIRDEIELLRIDEAQITTISN